MVNYVSNILNVLCLTPSKHSPLWRKEKILKKIKWTTHTVPQRTLQVATPTPRILDSAIAGKRCRYIILKGPTCLRHSINCAPDS